MKFLKKILNIFKDIIDTFFLMVSSFAIIFTRWNVGRKTFIDLTLNQILYTGIGGLLIIGIAGFGIGLLITIILSTFELNSNILNMLQSTILSEVLIKELSPLLTALMLTSRSGTAIATEVGNMNANREFDALTSMGIDVIHFVIAPRIIGMVIAILALNIYFCFLAVISSGLTLTFYGISFNVFMSSFFKSIDFSDIILSLIKTIGCGLIISAVTCNQAYTKSITFTEVPKILTKSIGRTIIWVFLYYGFVTLLSYL